MFYRIKTRGSLNYFIHPPKRNPTNGRGIPSNPTCRGDFFGLRIGRRRSKEESQSIVGCPVGSAGIKGDRINGLFHLPINWVYLGSILVFILPCLVSILNFWGLHHQSLTASLPLKSFPSPKGRGVKLQLPTCRVHLPTVTP